MINQGNKSLQQNLRWLLLPVLFAFILLLTILIHSALQQNMPGADFYIFWNAGKSFFIDRINPYSLEVITQNQLGILHRLAGSGKLNLAFAYPFYSLFGILPNIFLSFDWALSLSYAANLVWLICLLFWIFPEQKKLTSISVFLLFPIVFGLVMGNFAIPITLALLFFYGLIIQKGYRSTPIQAVSGVLLAWATLKPQFVWLLLIFALMYAWKNKLRPFLIAFFSGLAFLIALSFALLPDWLTGWLHIMKAYAVYQQVNPAVFDLIQAVAPQPIVQGLGIIILALLAVVSILLLVRWWKGKETWLLVAAWLGMTTFLFHPHGMSYEQIPSLIPMILWMAMPGTSKSRTATAFWVITILLSWLPLFLRGNNPAIEKAPVLLIAVWITWLARQNTGDDAQVSPVFTV
ncbi:MAG: hypothetical protein GYA42_09495 [Syntrophomonadaceae bacterium]|nr:hypothetical protein [Syntrophomonadaceae bacterium]